MDYINALTVNQERFPALTQTSRNSADGIAGGEVLRVDQVKFNKVLTTDFI